METFDVQIDTQNVQVLLQRTIDHDSVVIETQRAAVRC
jgi:hypothetical protein